MYGSVHYKRDLLYASYIFDFLYRFQYLSQTTVFNLTFKVTVYKKKFQAIFLTLIGSALFWVTTEAADAFAVELYDKTSIYGEFDKEDECWTDGPENPTLPVSDDCIPASTK